MPDFADFDTRHYRTVDVAVSTHVHLVSDHVRAAVGAGWHLVDMVEGLVDHTWIGAKPRWERFRGHPNSTAFAWHLPE